MKISKRLERVACTVTPGYTVADIGTDHGYVPIYLIKNHLAAHVIAMDINEGPLKHARENIRQYGFEELIETRLSNGFEKLGRGEADAAVIAGMGGELMKNILMAGRMMVNDLREMVLSPHSEIYIIREYVGRVGHKIVSEEMLFDEGKYYTIIKTTKGRQRAYSKTEYKYGAYLIEKKDEVFLEYLEKKREKYLLILDNLRTNSSGKASDRYIQIRDEIQEIEGILT